MGNLHLFAKSRQTRYFTLHYYLIAYPYLNNYNNILGIGSKSLNHTCYISQSQCLHTTLKIAESHCVNGKEPVNQYAPPHRIPSSYGWQYSSLAVPCYLKTRLGGVYLIHNDRLARIFLHYALKELAGSTVHTHFLLGLACLFMDSFILTQEVS